MKECDLYAPVRDWLHANGWTVYPEVFDGDIVATRGQEIACVELKVGMHATLDRQLLLRSQWADWVYAAVPARCYKRRAQWAYLGYGVLTVDNGKAKSAMKPRRQPDHWWRRHAYRLKKLAARNPAHADDRAGLPAGAERVAVRRRALGLDSIAPTTSTTTALIPKESA